MNKINKTWKREGVYDDYESALEKKQLLLIEQQDLEVKIKRYGREGLKFQVKTYYPKEEKKNETAKKKKKKRAKRTTAN